MLVCTDVLLGAEPQHKDAQPPASSRMFSLGQAQALMRTAQAAGRAQGPVSWTGTLGLPCCLPPAKPCLVT